MSISTFTVTAKPKAAGIKVAKETGPVITEVAAGSHGSELGLKSGMRIIAIGGRKVTSAADVTLALTRCKKAMAKYDIELEVLHEALAEGDPEE